MLTSDWMKSSWSFSNGNCVEARAGEGAVQVRDSTDPAGPVLDISPEAWRAFLATLRPRPVPQFGPVRLFPG